MRYGAETEVQLQAASQTRSGVAARMVKGLLHFFHLGPPSDVELRGPAMVAGAKGTEFVVRVTEDGVSEITVFQGEVEMLNPQFPDAPLRFGSGEQAVVEPGQPPRKTAVLDATDIIQWCLYYPGILNLEELPLDSESRSALAEALTAYQQGRLLEALERFPLEREPRSAEECLFRAAVLLAAGQAGPASEWLERSTALTSADPNRMARLRRALELLIETVKGQARGPLPQPELATEWLAQSYYHQARHELDAALTAARAAWQAGPRFGFAAVRVAELEFSFGRTQAAREALTWGQTDSPWNAQAYALAGFVHAAEYRVKAALEAFGFAVELDPWLGNAWLGRGLCRIRQGDVTGGVTDLEVAAFLEPQRSLLRSYLGKGFFEAKADALAAKEYEYARQLDPNDPTPYLYSAYHKLANYRPVEALWDLEGSIARNGNRAVYRSRFLLDQDEAVRSVGLAQVFNQVGFREAGRSEAIKSINRDYANHSAHLLLSGSYFEQPQLNLAVISEQLVARLLSPVNINSLRGEVSLNEYTSLFDRDRAQFFLLSEARSADQMIQGAPRVTAAFDRLAVAAVYGARHQGGYRSNDDAELLAPGFLAQYQLTARDTLSTETLQFDYEEGDTAIGFNPNYCDPDFRREVESFTQRLGWHHRFGPGSHLLAQGLYFRRDESFEDFDEPSRLIRQFPGIFPPGSTQDQTRELSSEGGRGDVQHIWDTRLLTVVSGGGVLGAQEDKEETTEYWVTDPDILDPTLIVSSQGNTPTSAQRAYLYPTWHFGDDIDLTTGVAYGRIQFAEVSVPPYDDATEEREKFLPKVGMVWRVTPGMTLRAAYFGTLGAASSADLESLEPTQVAGFNQLFDDPVGTEAQGWGLGWDQKFAKRTYLGAALFCRRLDSPFGIDLQPGLGGDGTNVPMTEHVEECGLRGYYYQVLHRTLTFTTEYDYLHRQADTADYPTPFADATDDANLTHRLRLGLNYFHPTGWFASLGATWRHQTLENFEVADGVANGTQSFWILDASVGYQFPRRTGAVTISFNNLLDRDYRYQPVGLDSRFYPDVNVGVRLFLNF
jgi:hypothetical protein